MKTINEVRKEILDELNIDISTEVIRRDEGLGIFKLQRNKKNDFRVFSEEDVDKIKLIALLRDIGIPRDRLKMVLEGNKSLVWNKINRLAGTTIPQLKERMEIT